MVKTLTRQDDRKQAGDSLKAALARQPVIAAVDLGASKVACFVMKPDGVRRSDRTLTTAGVGYVQSRGVKGATISSMDEAAEAIALGLIKRPLPAVVDSLRHHSLPLDPRQEANLRRCLQLAGITAAELELGLSDRPHVLQTALQLLSDADDAAG